MFFVCIYKENKEGVTERVRTVRRTGGEWKLSYIGHLSHVRAKRHSGSCRVCRHNIAVHSQQSHQNTAAWLADAYHLPKKPPLTWLSPGPTCLLRPRPRLRIVGPSLSPPPTTLASRHKSPPTLRRRIRIFLLFYFSYSTHP